MLCLSLNVIWAVQVAEQHTSRWHLSICAECLPTDCGLQTVSGVQGPVPQALEVHV